MPTDTPAAPALQALQHFTLDELAVYTAEQAFGPNLPSAPAAPPAAVPAT